MYIDSPNGSVIILKILTVILVILGISRLIYDFFMLF